MASTTMKSCRRLARSSCRSAFPGKCLVPGCDSGRGRSMKQSWIDEVMLDKFHRSWPMAVLVAALVVAGGCRKTEPASTTYPIEAPPPVQVEPLKETRPELPPLFRDIEKRTFQFFWDTTNERNGLTPDRYPSRPFASIASVGFALTAYPIGVEKGWISRNQAVDRTLLTLEFLRKLPQGPQRTGRGRYHGFYYHFLDMQTGHRYESWVELSSVDTALLMMGVLFSQSYYDKED